MAREIIDTGIPGDAGTGDTINAGGQKINNNTNAIWNTLAGDDDVLVPTGPFTSTVPDPMVRNRKYEVNTSGGSVNLNLAPAADGLYFTGDVIHIRDSRGNWGTSPVIVTVTNDDGDIRGNNSVTFNSAYTEIKMTCVNGTQNSWVYEIIGLNQENNQIIDINASVVTGSPVVSTLYDTDVYHAVKILVVASNNVSPDEKTVSEILITDDGTDVVFTDYAVINTTGTGEPIVDFSFALTSNNVVLTTTITDDFSSASLQIIDIQRIEKLN